MNQQPTPLQKQINSIVVTAKSLVVQTAEHLQAASDFLVACGKRKEMVHKEFDDNIGKAFTLHKSLTAQRKRHLDPVIAAENSIKQKVSAYQIEEDRKKREEEAEAAKAARAEVEKEKTAESEQLESEGYHEEAVAVKTEVRPVVKTVAPKVKAPAGLSFRTNWKIEVLDEKRLIKEAPQFAQANQTLLNATVKSLKEKCEIPGCKVWAEKTPIQKKV